MVPPGIRCGLGVVLLLGLGACRDREAALAVGEETIISTATGVGAAPNVAVAADGREAVAWIAAPGGGTDGRLYVQVASAAPTELVDPLGPIEAHAEAPPKLVWDASGSLLALYVVSKVEPGRRFPLSALRSTRSGDGGGTWSAPVTVTDDGDFGSHNFHALYAARDGAVYASWLDGRAGSSGAYLARSSDGASTWGANVRASIDDACPCCRTAIAADTGGVVYLAWRTVLPGNIRDIVLARSLDAGVTWEPPVRVHADDWEYDGCPHAGPSLVVDAEHRVHIAWWTGVSGRAGVQYARADDGRTFSAPVPIAVASASRPSHPQLVVDGARVAVVWDDGFTPRPDVRARVSVDGGRSFGPTTVLSGPERVAMFPVVAVVGSAFRVLWTEDSPAGHDHAEAQRPDMRDPSVAKGLTPVGTGRIVSRTVTIR
jgi:hypothetical protein